MHSDPGEYERPGMDPRMKGYRAAILLSLAASGAAATPAGIGRSYRRPDIRPAATSYRKVDGKWVELKRV
jgi:hypothetical protein